MRWRVLCILCLPLWAEETLAPGQSAQKTVTPAAPSFYEIHLETRGMAAAVEVRAGGRITAVRKLTAADLLPVPLCWIAAAEPQEITVRSLEATVAARYTMRIEAAPVTPALEARARGCAAYDGAVQAAKPAAKVEALQEALRHFEAAGDQARQARVRTDLGGALWDTGKRAESVASHERAVAIWLKLTDPRQRAMAQYRLAVGYVLLNQIPRGKELLRAASALAREVNAPWLEAAAQTDLALQISREGQYAEAVAMLERAVSLAAAFGDRKGEGDSHNVFAIVEQNAGKLDRALEEYSLALALRRQTGDEAGVAQVLNNIATVRGQEGQALQAIAAFEEVLAIRRRVATPAAVANTQHNLAVQRLATGDYDESIQLFEAALATWRAEKFPFGEASTRGELAKLYDRLGMDERAETEQRRALAIHREMKNRKGEASAIHSLATLLRRRGELAAAERLYGEALEIARQAPVPQEHARVLQGLGRTHSLQGRHEQAIVELREAVEIGRNASRMDVPSMLNSLAGALEAASRDAEAIALLRTIPEQARAIENRGEEAAARAALARLLLRAGDTAGARDEVMLALDQYEDQRAHVASPDLRAQFLRRRREVYRLGARILMKRGEANEAFALSERGRGRALLDLMEASKIEGAAGAAMLARERELRSAVAAKAERLTRLLAGEGKGSAETLRREIGGLLDEHARVRERIAREDPRFDEQAKPASAREMQARLRAGEAIVSYSLGSEEGHGWLVTRERITGVTLPGRPALKRTVDSLQAALSEPLAATPSEDLAHVRARMDDSRARASAAARELERLLIRPLLGQRLFRKLYIVADAELLWTPFAAMEGLRRTEIVMLPSASLLPRLAPRAKPAGRIAVFADAVFEKTDARFDTPPPAAQPEPAARLRFPRLRFSAHEADAVAAVAKPGSRLLLTGFEATRAAALNASLPQFGVLHFATHAVLDERQPELSGIVLSLYDRQRRPVNGFLRLHDIAQMRLASPLVVLSACQTALGKSVDGEGLIGLSRAFLAAGASGVVATLWQVDDSATAHLVRVFYERMLRGGLTPGAALHAAQHSVRAQAKWSHPFYWAGFIYTGGS